jgi:hypothetical protein
MFKFYNLKCHSPTSTQYKIGVTTTTTTITAKTHSYPTKINMTVDKKGQPELDLTPDWYLPTFVSYFYV